MPISMVLSPSIFSGAWTRILSTNSKIMGVVSPAGVVVERFLCTLPCGNHGFQISLLPFIFRTERIEPMLRNPPLA